MQISPAYDGPPILSIEGLGDPCAAVRRQRLRLLEVLRSLDASQWAAPTRCEKWSVKDVVSHLVGTDRFWAIAFGAGINGQPTRFLESFDPVATPEEMVDGMRAQPAQVVLTQYEAQVNNVLSTLGSVADWSVRAEAPPGHLALNVAVLHALWDAWVHERDISIPLGLPVVEDEEEVALILQYAAALSPAFSVASGSGKRGALVVEATSPDMTFTVDVDERVSVRRGDADGARLSGRAVDLIEGLSYRAPLPELPTDDQWLLVGLAEVFDVA
ncbi:MAG: hypothetical protein QOK28_3643 [Actinomycetota bacterium]|jgi:uncharacterized protein (TIGR03083 family)